MRLVPSTASVTLAVLGNGVLTVSPLSSLCSHVQGLQPQRVLMHRIDPRSLRAGMWRRRRRKVAALRLHLSMFPPLSAARSGGGHRLGMQPGGVVTTGCVVHRAED